jgi:hypothetical protein
MLVMLHFLKDGSPKGCLWMFIVGPSTTPAFFSFASIPRHSPIWADISVLNVAPTQARHGKHVAFDGAWIASTRIPFGLSLNYSN